MAAFLITFIDSPLPAAFAWASTRANASLHPSDGMRERKNLSLRFFQALCRPPASPSSSPRRVGVPPPPPKSTLGGAGGGTARSPATPPGPRRWYQGELPGGPPLNPRGVPQPPGVGRSRANPPGPRRWHQGELPDRGSALPAGLRAARGGGGRGGGRLCFTRLLLFLKKFLIV